MKFTEKEIDIITEFHRMGEPLPKEFKEKILFQGDDNVGDEEAHIKHPLIQERIKGLIGPELKRQGLFDKIRMIASTDIAVLIEGERGTGKKLIAQTIHEIGSRANGPFIMADCSSMSEDLSESLLSGHEREAFPVAIEEKKGLIEMADQGTIVFNEIDKLPPKSQAIMLRFLQNKTTERLGSNKQIPVDTRVIATSDQNLRTAVKEGRFRNDLYFHINSINLSIPPLCARQDDVVALADFFLIKYGKLNRKKIRGFSPPAIEALWHHNWPGNITELESRIKGAVTIATGSKLTPEDLCLDIPRDKDKYVGMSLKEARDNLEKELILKALSKHRHNITRASEELGISRPSLYGLMEKLKIN